MEKYFLVISLIFNVIFVLSRIYYRFKNICENCDMRVIRISHELINNSNHTNCLKKCIHCGDWEVERIDGFWTLSDFKDNEL